MTSTQQIEFIESLDKRTLDLIKSKSKDYADKDVLSNFKTMSELCSLIGIDTKTSEGCGMYMVLLKIVRIWNLKKDGKTPENESLKDSYEDGINYFKLALCCEVEKKPLKKEDKVYDESLSLFEQLSKAERDAVKNIPYPKAFEMKDEKGFVEYSKNRKLHIDFWVPDLFPHLVD